MIVLRKIKFQNWGPFFGDSNDTNVINHLSEEQNFIFAATNTGKSTIMNGLRWLLMNKIDEKEAKITNDYKCKDCRLYFNKDALENNDLIFSVTASFFDDRTRQNIQLVRKVQLNDRFLKDHNKNPKLSKYDFLCKKTHQEYENYSMNKCTVFFTDENNNVVDKKNEINIDDFLKNFFPSDLANFYFSTGKNLEEVKSTATMDQEVESVLGLSKLSLLQKVLISMSNKQQQILSEKKSQNKQHTDTKIAIGMYNNKINIEDDQIKANYKFIKELEVKKQIIEEKLKEYPDNIKNFLDDRKTIKSKISSLNEQINEKKTQALKNDFKNVWKGLSYKKFIQFETSVRFNDDEQDLIRSLKALRIDESSTFKTELFDSRKIGSELANIIDNHYDEIGDDSNRHLFSPYRQSVEDFLEKYQSYENLLDKKNLLDFKLEELDAKIGNISESEGENISSEIKILDKNLGKIDSYRALISDHREKIKNFQNERREEENKLKNFKIDTSDVDAVKDKIISDIIRCVDSAILDAKNASHSLFQKYVNEFHDKLKDPIRNQNYTIKIDKSYEYLIMERRHEKLDPILNPTGSEDVYARVSLNLALVKIAVHKFPIFLDNPIEQLNDKGKERLTRIFENLDRQLIIILFDEKNSDNFWQSPEQIQKFYSKSKSYSLSNDSDNNKKTNIKSLNL